jgi:hypothetical protein
MLNQKSVLIADVTGDKERICCIDNQIKEYFGEV